MTLRVIKNKIYELQNKNFTGAIKIGMEAGEVFNIGVANNFDVPWEKIKECMLPDQFLLKTKEELKTMYGNICYYFYDGIITKYAIALSFKGNTLQSFIDGDIKI